MGKIWAGIVLALTLVGGVHAQTARELAHTLAQTTVDVAFRDLKPKYESAVDLMEQAAKDRGPLTIPSGIFINELRKAIRRDNLIVVIGNVLARDMTRNELQETLKFMKSSAGKKFRLATTSVKDSDLSPIFREACEHTRKSVDDLSIRDPLLEQDCAQFK